jgi:hypothetical protein
MFHSVSDRSPMAAAPPIVIVVSPIRSGRFQATLESTGELLVASSRQPFLDSARVLLAQHRSRPVSTCRKSARSPVRLLHAGTTRWGDRWARDTRVPCPAQG